jgi:hypothetical protein
MSADFVHQVDLPVTSVGRHDLRGIARSQELFKLTDS